MEFILWFKVVGGNICINEFLIDTKNKKAVKENVARLHYHAVLIMQEFMLCILTYGHVRHMSELSLMQN